MKHTLLVVAVALGIVSNVVAQNVCGTDQYYQQLIQENPEIENQLEETWQISDGPLSSSRSARAKHIIPVVVHVIHDNDVGNISYEQIEDGIRVLNEDYSRTNSDTSNTRAIFKSVASDPEIEFRLAKIDPDGNCTNGVVRINSPAYAYDADNSVKSLSYWPSNQYLNFWLVESIENTSSTGTILGYAQFPGSGSWTTYGVVERNDAWGTIGTSTADGRTTSHEVGHCLNLMHTFQSGCGSNCSNSGDRVCDTPPSLEATYGCVTGQNTCSNDANGSSTYSSDVVDQIENYMSYDACQNMFTEGQKTRMKNALTSISQLINLTSEANLIATGVYDNEGVLCKAEFSADRYVVCAGESIDFTDNSYFNVSSRDWSFDGGYPSTSTSEEPTILYDTPGTYSVTLEVSDGTSTVSTTEQAIITVLPSPGEYMPFEESFEFSNLENEYWTVDTAGGYGWELTSAAAYSGTNAIKMNNFDNSYFSYFNAYSPSYDLSNLNSGTLTFKYAYVPRSSASSDVLRIYFSRDCGASWSLRYALSGSSLNTTPLTVQNSDFTPSSQSHWEEQSINISSNYLTENFRVMFRFEPYIGNNLYIDDINIDGDFSDIPVLNSPENGETGIGSSVTLDWKSTGEVYYYEMELDTNDSFTSPTLFTTQTSWLSYDPNDIDTRYDASGLMLSTTYYWRVRTIASTGYSNWSNVWSFTVSETGVGMSELGNFADEINVYPNPTSGDVNVEMNMTTADEVILLVRDLRGAVVMQKQISTSVGVNRTTLNVGTLSKGMYLIEAKTDGVSSIQRLVVQ
ncbi:MAG: hypothetical protein CL843_19930 [Crocinitomicaceae bacterium]|nr:hypothetical protein [Crocinitomicaceae bacterium]